MKPIKYEDFLKQITIVIDQQEKVNYWIIDYLKKLKINYSIQHMKFGDYCFLFNGTLQKIIIERKNSLTELSSNLSSVEKRTRFYKEFEKAKSYQKHLIIENDNIDNLLSGTYGTDYNINSYIANFILLQKRNDLNIHFINRYNMGIWILKLFYYYYYETLKNI
jgi:hypothetical protein